MSLGGENIEGFLRGFGGLVQLNNGVEVVARQMPSASIASFRAASVVEFDPDTGEVIGGGFPESPLEPRPSTPVGFGVNVIPGVDNTILIGVLVAIGGIAFALIFGEEIARQVRSIARI